MARVAVPPHRLIRTTSSFSAIPAIVLVAMAALGLVGVGVAILILLLVIVGTAGVVWLYLSDLRAVEDYVEQLAREGHAETPVMRKHGSLPGLATTIGHLSRSWDRHQERLAQLSESTDMILENLPQPLVLIDAQRRVVRATLAARELLGDVSRGDDLAALLRHPDLLEATDRVIAGGAREEVEITLSIPINRTFSAWVVPLPATASDGTMAILSLYDMTSRRRSDQMRVDFIANASHELRTPLSVLLGGIKTLRGAASDDPEAQEKFLALMDFQAERMSRLVDDLLSLSRIEMNEHRAPSQRLDVSKVVRQVADALDMPAGARNVRITVEAPEVLPPVLGDESELTQLFQNLIDNAIKYGGEGSAVTVSFRAAAGERPVGYGAAGDALEVTVADQGEGIPPEHIPRLTERFYRVDTGRSREMGGTGLGLAIVKHIIGRHRGALQIRSTPGEGSRFSVFLPMAPATGEEPVAGPERHEVEQP